MCTDHLIPEVEVQVLWGRAGLIGKGAMGEVRRGRYRGVEVALKQLHMLRTDAASIQEGIIKLTITERRALQREFLKECALLQRVTHPNIVPFVGIVVDSARFEPLSLAGLACQCAHASVEMLPTHVQP